MQLIEGKKPIEIERELNFPLTANYVYQLIYQINERGTVALSSKGGSKPKFTEEEEKLV